ncbi:putative beta-glucosidase I [Psilocybe cubensis]|uniref:Beta-glucosidase I n=2 Tax=Psilocybe cubensis TaxID=181762 RepID=A0ACB8H7N1_PSICU|nr:putative beta-glucosidase I [Psilocybe cubensis]KAH9483793.1 putative beta-glucosidase I [Psilocybe cubensis]
MSRTFLDASIPDLVKKLRVDEKISLLGAPNWWNTTTIERLGIPSIRMSDGPNGVRGSSHFVPTPAQCLPCATALASTFDPGLVKRVGVFLAQEAKLKSSVILLAPTCNIQRTPLGGRSFESFSEDPHLSGTLAAAYVNGLQSQGVAATIKHFVANDQEDERTAVESVMSDRALREIYLYPFMLAQKHAKPGAFMTSYGRISGVHCSENKELLTNILRKEWKFNGIVISDWFGTYGVDQPINAGLDLEMPGPPRWRTSTLVLHCLSAKKLAQSTIDERVTNLLTFVQKQARKNPEIVFGDGAERSRDTPEGRQFCRALAAEGIVLLKNNDNLLPFSQEKPLNIAIIGPSVKERVISGGGSAQLKATYVVTPWTGINDGAHPDSTIQYHVGCYAHKYLPTLEANLKTPRGEPGWLCTFFSHDENGEIANPVQQFTLNDTRVKLNDFLPKGLTPTWSIKLEGKLTIDKTCLFELGLTVAGRAKLWINGSLLIDNWTKQTPGDFFYGQGTIEEKATINLNAGQSVDVLVLYTNTPPPDGDDENGEGRLSQPALMRGVRLGGCEKIDEDKAIDEAVALAKSVDAVVLVGGLTPEWESEGFDRPSLKLPGRQDELFARVAEANSRTVACIQAGSAVSMPWVDKVGGLLQTWYSGNESGNGIADILYGKVNPSGRLPLTLPVRIEDIPAYLNDRSENAKIHYREDLFVGYKHYQARGVKPLFPFGFGLSYTSFSLSDLVINHLTPYTDPDTLQLDVGVTVKNEGDISGSEVVQLYVSFPDIGLTTPKLQLKGFAKAHNIESKASTQVNITLDKYAFSFWDETTNSWKIAAGKYGIHIGPSSDNMVLNDTFESKESFSWTGL